MAEEKAELSSLSDVYQPQQQPPPPYQQGPSSAPQESPPPFYHQPSPSIPPGMTVVHPSTLTGYQTNGVTMVNHNVPGGPVTVVPMVGTTVVSAIVVPAVGQNPTAIQCRSCQQRVVTKVHHMPSIRTHLTAALLCLLGCWPCVFLPYCMDSCKNADHYCPNCNAYIGSYV